MPITYTRSASRATPAVQPGWLRISHWINALAVLVMVTSGWRIYNASPLFDFRFADGITLGGWLGGALQWHFAGMWLLALNGVFYLACNIGTGRMQSRFFPIRLSALASDAAAALRGKLTHADPRQYNSIQRLAYLFAVIVLALLVLSGLALWKPVQFALLRDLFGGYEFTRRVHFFAMAGLIGFIVVHVAMVAIVPRTLLTMIRGR